jgi:hypothetical protein
MGEAADKRTGSKALHTLGAPEKPNEITAVPVLLDQLAEAVQLEGAPATIDAMGMAADVAAYFETGPMEELASRRPRSRRSRPIFVTEIFPHSRSPHWPPVSGEHLV